MNIRNRITTGIFLYFSFEFLLNNVAYAQEAKQNAVETNAMSGDKVHQVEIKAKSETENSRYYAASKTIVSNEQLNRYGDSNIFDSLKHVPGVIVSDDSISLPGLPSSYVKILIDGESRNGVALKNVPLESIERVEISRLGSAEYSNQAIGGTINIVLKKNLGTKQDTFKVAIVSKSWDQYDISWLSTDKMGQLSYSSILTAHSEPRISSSRTIEENTEFGANGMLLNSYENTDKLRGASYDLRYSPRLQFRTRDSDSYTISGAINQRVNHIDRDFEVFVLAGDSEKPYKQWLNSHRKYSSAVADFRMKSTIASDIGLDLFMAANGSFQKNSYHIFSTQNSIPNASSERESSTQNFGLKNSIKISFPLEEDHLIVGGGVFSRNSTRFVRTEWESISFEDRTQVRNQATIDNIALFVQDEWKINKRYSMYLGLRWESLKIHNVMNLSDYLERRFEVASPILQSLLMLNDANEDRLRIGVARAYKAPNEAQIATPKIKTFINSMYTPQALSNPQLRPELAWSISTAYEHEGKDGLNYNLRYTFRNIKDLHQTAVNLLDNYWVESTINSGSAQSKLLEFDSTFPLRRFHEGSPNIDANLYVYKNWSDVSSLAKPDNVLTPVPWSINIGIDFKASRFPLNAGVNFGKDGSRWVRTSLEYRTLETQTAHIEAYVLWTLDKKAKFRASLTNLTRPTIVKRSEYLSSQSSFYTRQSTAGRRGILLTFEYEL